MRTILKTPETIQAHQVKYKPNAWKQYTVQELGMWVHLFLKRAKHRSDKAKRDKDILDAQNYLNMMQEHINAIRAS